MSVGKHLLQKVFLSHSAADKVFVRRLARRIQASGFGVWLDEHELVAGDQLSDSIANAVTKAKVVLVVVSPASVKSKWLRYELNLATENMVNGKCRVIPVLIADCAIPAAVHGLLYADFRSSFASGLKSILTALQHEASRAAKAGGFWAQTTDAVSKIFGGRGWSSGGGEFENFEYEFVSVDGSHGDATVVYDIVSDHLKARRPITEAWWEEYTDVRRENDEDLFLVASERPVEFDVESMLAPGNCVKYRRFAKDVLSKAIGHVVIADLSSTRSSRGRDAILRSARTVLTRLAESGSVPASA